MSKSSKQTIDVQTEYDQFHLEGYPCGLSAHSFIPTTRKNQIKEGNLSNSQQQVNFENLNKKTNLFKFR
jgi:hypothetical protein